MLATVAAPLLQALCAPRAWRFARALDAVESTQRNTLQRIVRAVAATDYARVHGLHAEDDLAAFRDKIPTCDYADVAPWIARQQQDPRAPAIAPGRVRCFEPTSGSGGAHKLIPYNDAVLGTFRSMFAVWAHDLLRHRLRLRSGRIFASVSPAHGGPRGLDDDRDYLGGLQRALVGHFLLTPPPRAANDLAAFRRQLAIDLITCADLEIISVWHPGYLLVVMDDIEARDPTLLAALPRAQQRVLERSDAPWMALWPKLQLVSCWNSAAAQQPAAQLARRLPQARLQGKGLLATEAPITLPLEAAGGCVPMLDEVFLEFEREDGRIDLLHELEASVDYAVLVTQGGGLLRYRLGDRVQVTGRYRDTPLLGFVGRVDAVSDLVGEKLHEDFVSSALAVLFADAGFVTLVPVLPDFGQPFYACLTDAVTADPAALSVHVDQALREALRYREARALGQLRCVQVIACSDMRRRVQDHWSTSGMRLGDIKERRLITALARAQQLYSAILQSTSRDDCR